MEHCYKFSDTAIDNPEGLSAYQLLKRLENGEKLDDHCPLFSELWHPESYRYGIIRQMGWLFDFTPFLKKYLVKTKYYGWNEQYATSKTSIRLNSVCKSHILKIIDYPE